MQVDERAEAAGGASREAATRAGLPWPAVAAALLGVLVLMLAVALWADSTLRPKLGVQPVATVAAAPPPTPAPTAIPLAALTPAPTAAPTSPPTPAPPATAPTAEPTPTPWWLQRNEVSPELRQEIADAYLHYWDVVAQAYLNLDTSHLSEVVAGKELAEEEKVIDELHDEGRAQDLRVEHNGGVVYASSDEAVIYDAYVGHGKYVDPETKVPQTIESTGATKISLLMQKLDGTWKIVDGVRYED